MNFHNDFDYMPLGMIIAGKMNFAKYYPTHWRTCQVGRPNLNYQLCLVIKVSLRSPTPSSARTLDRSILRSLHRSLGQWNDRLSLIARSLKQFHALHHSLGKAAL